MKQIHSGLIAVIAAVFFGFTACKKDAPISDPVSNPPKTYYPLQIKGVTSSTIFKYTSKPGNLESLTKINRDSTISYWIIYNSSYLPDHLIHLVNNTVISHTYYTLNAQGEVIKGEVYHLDNPWDYGIPSNLPSYLKFYYTLAYNSSGQLSQVSYYHANGQKNYDKLFYYYPDGNISQIHSSDTIHLDYDSFNGLAKNVEYMHLLYLADSDNLLFYTRNNLSQFNELSHSYKYNNDNFPVEMAVRYPDGTKVFTIEYVK